MDNDSIKFGRSMIRRRAITDWTLHVFYSQQRKYMRPAN
jgi:hypothetical protein